MIILLPSRHMCSGWFCVLAVLLQAAAAAQPPQHRPMAELRPGETYDMDTRWFPVRLTGRASGVTDAGIIASPITVSVRAGRIRISGFLGVFFPGKLVARFADASGIVIGSVDLATVAPQAPVELLQELQLPVGAKRISIRLIDDQQGDRGTLWETPIASGGKEF